MRANAVPCIHNTHKEEGSFTKNGGWTINPADPGNWTGGKRGVGVLKGTKYGIAANTYPHLDIKNLTLAQADAIYVRDYWPKAWGDEWPVGLDQVTYDATVNSGPGRGPLWTCRALGYSRADRSATAKARALTTEGKVAAVKKAAAIRMGFLRALGTFSVFGKGWTGRCARMEAIGVKMVLTDAKTAPAEVEKKMKAEAKAAGNASTAATTTGGAVTTGTGATVAQDPALATFDWVTVSVAALIVCVLIFAGYKAFAHYQRKKAYLDAAAS